MGSKGSMPASPDYASLIPLQAQSNLNTFNTMLGASRINSVTPYGQQYWVPPSGSSGGSGNLAQEGTKTAQGTAAPPPEFLYQENLNPDAAGQRFTQTPNPEYAAWLKNGGQTSGGQFSDGGVGAAAAEQGPWTFVQQLSPEQQALYNQDLAIRQGQGNIAQGMMGNVSDIYSNPANFAGMLPQFQNINAPGLRNAPGYNGQSWQGPSYQTNMNSRDAAEQAIYNRQLRYDQPYLDRQRQQTQDALLAMGANVNDERYRNAMSDLNTSQDKYMQDAIDRAILGGGQEATAELNRGLSAEQARFGAGQSEAMNQFNTGLMGQQYATGQEQFGSQFGAQQQAAALQNALAGVGVSQADRARYLNELNAFRTGNQIQLPGTPAQTSTPNLQGTDYLGTAQQNYANQMGQYNAQQAGANNFMNGLFGLGSAWLMGGRGF